MRLLDRLGCAFLGALFGALWGLILAIGAGYFTDGHFQTDLLLTSIASFAALGMLLGPVVGDVIGVMLHFVYGLFAGVMSGAGGQVIDPQPREVGWLRSMFVLGFGSGVAIWIWWRYF